MRFYIKILLLICLILVNLISFRVFTFENNIIKNTLPNKNVIEFLSTATYIDKVEYYKNQFSSETNEEYMLYISSKGNGYLIACSNSVIDTLTTSSILFEKLKPNKINPLHFSF